MNRQTILAVIHRQLRESLVETGEVRPLGEIVGSVAEEIRPASNGQLTSGVIPIETAAAFVDGNLSAEESRAVCQAVMVDNSVLAELVSAVRSIQQPVDSLDPLPAELRNQLIAMHASLSAPAPPIEAVDDLPIAEEESTAALIKTDVVVRRSSENRHRSFFDPIVALLSVAAVLAAIIFVATRDNQPDPERPEIAQDESVVPEPSTLPITPEPTEDAGVRFVDANDDPGAPPEPDLNMKPIPDSVPSPVVVQQDPAVVPEMPHPAINPVVPEPDSTPQPPSSSLAQATEWSGIRWTKITGVLTRANRVAVTSASRATMWEAVQSGTSPAVDNGSGQLRLRTMPLSRAEASLQSGGRVVLAADSGVEVSKGDPTISAEIRLRYGDLALIDLPEGTQIRLIKAGHPLATLRWHSKASAVLQHAADGLEVHVRHGTIDINDQPQQDASVTIARDRVIRSIEQPKRMPAWVDRPVETINVKQAFLAQIGESRNVMGTLNQQIRSLTQDRRVTDIDARTLATLAAWQASLAGENVIRLAASHMPAVRIAALNRIVTLPRWDPRYQRIWTAIEKVSRDQQRAARFKRLAFLAQRNGAPTAAQVDTMLDDLTSPDVASRAMSDYLLRRFHSKAARRLPNFDPTWTGQTQTRGVNLWRKYLGRNANAAQLQPAAAVNRAGQ